MYFHTQEGGMKINIQSRITDENFITIQDCEDRTITLDLSEMKYLTSKEISKLLYYYNTKGKQFILINSNDHIRETISILNMRDIFIIK